MNSYPPRIKKFREGLIRELPRAPNNSLSLVQVEAMPTRRLILAYLTWRMRFVPARPRHVTIWPGGMTPDAFRRVKPEIAGLLADVQSGADLTPRLSTNAVTKGIVLPGAKRGDKGSDLDSVLIQMGLHHFHVGTIGPENPQGRSGKLVFAEVSDDEFRVVTVAGHDAFEAGAPGRIEFMKVCLAYLSRDIGPREGFMLNPCMSSGHSCLLLRFSDQCENVMEVEDPAFDDRATLSSMYSALTLSFPEETAPKPDKMSLMWHLDGLQLYMLERKTGKLFPRFPPPSSSVGAV